jgi:hypothetical protein
MKRRAFSDDGGGMDRKVWRPGRKCRMWMGVRVEESFGFSGVYFKPCYLARDLRELDPLL